MSMELLATNFSRSFIRPPRRTARARRILKASSDFFRGWRRWTRSSMDLHARRPHTRRAQGGVSATHGPLSAATWIIRLRGSARAFVHRQLHIFLHRFTTLNTHCAAWRAAGVGESRRDKVKALADYKKIARARRLAAAAGIVRGGGCSFTFDAKTSKPLIQLADTELKKL